jgi:polysaccharide deacetylase family protein (PEP-CTERM system associated)
MRDETKETGNARSPRLANAMTVDVEDYFQVSAFSEVIDRTDWDRWPHRVERNTERVLAMFAEARIQATFFTLGWVAERYPQLVRRIADGGHEVASHGYSHWRVYEQSPDAFRDDIGRTKRLLEDVAGVAVKGYRAASFSLNAATPWAYDALAAEGYGYSSSVYPIRHDHYGAPDLPRFPFRPRSDLPMVEVPVTTVRVAGRNFPCGGGGYFRLLPYALSAAAIDRVNRCDRRPCMFYFHPWEIDPDQPEVPSASARARFRHTVNLSRMQGKLKRLLTQFSWRRIDAAFNLPEA